MIEQAALGEQHGDDHDLHQGPRKTWAAELLDHPPEQCSAADQHQDCDDAALAARAFAAGLAVKFFIEKSDRAAGEHDGMRDSAEDRRHVAEHAVDGERRNKQQQRVGRRRGHSDDMRVGQ